MRLYAHQDLLAVGRMADLVRERLHGDVVYYNINRHIEPTNVCATECVFCAFGRKASDPDAYEMGLEEVYERAATCVAEGATEVHIVAGLHPQYDLAWYSEMMRGLKARFPSLHLKCFTGVEIAYFANLHRLSHETVLDRLVAAGLDSMPGGGAEIFHPEVRTRIAHDKATADEYLEVHRIAHAMGIRTNITMLYGHIETFAHRVDHILRVRDLQDESVAAGKGARLQAFIPLAFHPDGNGMKNLPAPTAVDDLRTIAVSRLMLDNVDHIKAYWVSLTPDVAQIALRFGADDIDGTIVHETIYKAAGTRSPGALGYDELVRLIREAGRTPIERDTLYNVVKELPRHSAPEASVKVKDRKRQLEVVS